MICETLNEFQMVLGICPCCGDVFRLADCKMEAASFSSDEDEFTKIRADKRKMDFMGSRLREDLEILVSYEEDINTQLTASKKEAKEAGRKEAKQRLKKIDPIFSGRDIDPQDVRVLFNPVEYVVFSQMSGEGLDKIELISRDPQSSIEEKVCRSIEETVVRGDIDFQVVTVSEDGDIDCDKGVPKPPTPRKRRSPFPMTV